MTDDAFSYNEDGSVKGTPEVDPPAPVRLQWDLTEEVSPVVRIRCRNRFGIVTGHGLYFRSVEV